MPYDPDSGILFIARIETIVTAIQNNDLIVSAPNTIAAIAIRFVKRSVFMKRRT